MSIFKSIYRYDIYLRLRQWWLHFSEDLRAEEFEEFVKSVQKVLKGSKLYSHYANQLTTVNVEALEEYCAGILGVTLSTYKRVTQTEGDRLKNRIERLENDYYQDKAITSAKGGAA